MTEASQSHSQKNPEAIQASRALLKDLQEKHQVFRDCLPLAIGIDKQLVALYPELERKILRMTLRHHTRSTRYLKAVEKAATRSNLDGSAAEEITEAHRVHAAEQLHERFRKETERRKKQQEIAASEAAARQRAEKLEQLAAKFSRK